MKEKRIGCCLIGIYCAVIACLLAAAIPILMIYFSDKNIIENTKLYMCNITNIELHWCTNAASVGFHSCTQWKYTFTARVSSDRIVTGDIIITKFLEGGEAYSIGTSHNCYLNIKNNIFIQGYWSIPTRSTTSSYFKAFIAVSVCLGILLAGGAAYFTAVDRWCKKGDAALKDEESSLLASQT